MHIVNSHIIVNVIVYRRINIVVTLKKCANIGQKSHCLQEKLSRKSFTALFCELLVGHEPKSFLKRLDGVVFIRS